MDKYYCYIFYDENWCAYYVGYASYEGRFRSGHSVPIPDEEHRQIIRFKTSWEALECERELVAFWGRECDGGCLKNKAVGGTIGPTGFSHSEKSKKEMSITRTGRKHSEQTKIKIGRAHRGRVLPVEQRKKISATRKKRNLGNEHMTALKRKPITVRHIQTDNIQTFPSHREMERQLNIGRCNLLRDGKTKGWELVS